MAAGIASVYGVSSEIGGTDTNGASTITLPDKKRMIRANILCIGASSPTTSAIEEVVQPGRRRNQLDLEQLEHDGSADTIIPIGSRNMPGSG